MSADIQQAFDGDKRVALLVPDHGDWKTPSSSETKASQELAAG